ncbi:MAG: hypothetical protein U0414_42080 [Polyangiaceae bacterium]
MTARNVTPTAVLDRTVVERDGQGSTPRLVGRARSTMGWANDARDGLKAGAPVKVRPLGGSMRGRIESGQLVTIAPAKGTEVRPGDVVFVRWYEGFLLHLVKEARDGELLIGNNVGKINGWVPESAVLGKVIAVED